MIVVKERITTRMTVFPGDVSQPVPPLGLPPPPVLEENLWGLPEQPYDAS